MPRKCALLIVALMLALLIPGEVALADCAGFSGDVALDVTFTPIPPLSYNIESGLTLSLSVCDFTFTSTTVFDLSGFQSQGFSADIVLGIVDIGDDILFDPYFSWNDLSVAVQIVGIEIGTHLILADIGTPPVADYSMAAVISLSSGVACGFSITTLTGFGAVDLVNLLGGVTAPFSNDLLGLFFHTQTLFGATPTQKVTVISGFYFAEELVRLQMDYMGLLASSSTWFDWTGFSQEIVEFGYRFDEPALAFLTAITIDSSFSISAMDFILDLRMYPVRFTSRTSFSASTPPAIIPIVFSGQGFAISFELCGVAVTSTTMFDGTFMFAEQDLAIETTIDPVTLTSLTTFDTSGFSGQWIEAGVTFGGVMLYTRAGFDFGGIIEVTVGFRIRF
jgi:hypothetical protein